MPHRDRALGAVLTLVALGWLWLVQTAIPAAGDEWPGPRGFPTLLGIVLALLGVWLAAGSRPLASDGFGTRPANAAGELAMAGGTFAVLLAYAWLLERAGFLIATPLAIVLAMAGLLRMRRWVFIASLAAGFTVGCWTIFEALGTPLPRGMWMPW